MRGAQGIVGVLVCVLAATAAGPCRGDFVLKYSTTPLGGGLFRYNMELDNTSVPEPVAGLNVQNAGPVFGLTSASPIAAPANWDFFPPEFGVNELNFFSLGTS